MREPHKAGRVTDTIPRFFIFSSNQFCLGVGKDKNKFLCKGNFCFACMNVVFAFGANAAREFFV